MGPCLVSDLAVSCFVLIHPTITDSFHFFHAGSTYDYDLALLKVKDVNGEGIKFTDHVQPACLPEEDTEYTPDQHCHISGWGKTEHGLYFMLNNVGQVHWLNQ